jgi:hypothetical protein
VWNPTEETLSGYFFEGIFYAVDGLKNIENVEVSFKCYSSKSLMD